MGSRLRDGTTNYHPSHAMSSHKMIVCQDRYLVGCPKSQEREGANTPPAYELRLPTTLQPREQIMRSTTNKKVFLEPLSKCPMGEEIEITGERYRYYDHEEAGITMVGSALEKLSNGAKMSSLQLMTLLFWLCWFTSFRRKDNTGNIYIHSKRFDGRVIDVEASTTMLGPKCS